MTEEKLKELEEKVVENDTTALHDLGLYYFDLAEEYLNKAVEYLSKIAIDKNNIDAQYKLAKYYDYGIGRKDDNLAKDYYIRAANNGILEAKMRLGNLYYLGKKEITADDFDQPIYWWHIYDAKLNDELKSKIERQETKYKPEKVDVSKIIKRNTDDAIYWLKRAANSGSVDAQYELGCLYYYGDYEIEPDCNMAIYWLEKAAETDPHAMYQLGIIYYEGNGIDVNLGKSKYWIDLALKNDVVIFESEKKLLKKIIDSYECK